MATAASHQTESWFAAEGWLYCVDMGAVIGYMIMSSVAATSSAVGPGNTEPATSADTLAYLGSGAMGAVFGGLASMHLHRMKRFSWQSVRTIGAYSAVFGIGAVPLVFWGFDWPYRTDRIFGVAFAVALCAEMLTKVGGPILANAAPAFIEAFLRVRANSDDQSKRERATGKNQPDFDDSGNG